jgi:hypothetical protein
MGIRFNCPTCGKHLNIKSFLAGKRGVCPACNTKFEIPQHSGESARILSSDAGDEPPQQQPAAQPSGAQPSGAQPSGAQPAVAGPAASSPVAGVAVPQPSAQPSFVPSMAQAAPAAYPSPMTAGAAPAAGFPQPMAFPSGAVAAQPMAGAPAVQSMPGAMVQPLSMGHGPDPIAEAPQASWYVRPPAGGQYGPAQGNIMRQWIQERRVTPDSLVWREGWPDWKRADVTFPSLGAPAAAPQAAPIYPATVAHAAPVAMPALPVGGHMAPAAAAVPVGGAELGFAEPAASRPAGRGAYRRRGSGQGRVVAITLLILLVAILAPVLIYVLMQNS